MDRSSVKAQRMVVVCLLGFLLFNYPLLALFNVAVTVGGIPLLYAYMFCVWILLIATMAYVAEAKA